MFGAIVFGAAVGACTSRGPTEGATTTIASAISAASSDPVPCAGWADAVIGNTGGLTLNAQSLVDSYSSSLGPYGGGNVGSAAVVQTATVTSNNGGVLKGHPIAHVSAGLAVVPVPAGARNLGNININGPSDSITLVPGNYVAANINVNFSGAIKVSPAGQVRIWVTGTLNLGGNENLNGIPKNLAFLVTSAGSVNVNSRGSLFGLIYAPTSTVSVSSPIFGAVVGSSVTLNSGSAVHSDQAAACDPTAGGTPPPVAVHPPRPLPLPPTTQGCFQGTANGWVSIPCLPQGAVQIEATMEDEIDTPNGTSPTIPFQFGQVEATLTAFGGEKDFLAATATTNSRTILNAFSLQGNTRSFLGKNPTPTNPNNSDNDWIQFVIDQEQTFTRVFIETWDLTTWRSVGQQCPGNACVISCGCTNYGMGTADPAEIPNRFVNGTSPFVPFDFGTVAASVYTDDTGAPVIGMVAQFSWYDPANDPQDNRGLYATVATDQYDLAHHWQGFSGTILGLNDGSEAEFTDSSVLTRTLAGSCVNGTSPTSGIPWPGTCEGSPALLPDTTITEQDGTGENNNLCRVGSSTPLTSASTNLVYSENLASTSCSPASCLAASDQIFVKSTDEDTGVRPINIGTQAFWESPDLFLVPQGSPVDVNAVSTETLVTPGDNFDVYVRVNNDFGCDAVTGAQALLYIADPSALSTSWLSITGGAYQGGPNNAGVTVPAGGRALIGPFTFTAPTTIAGSGHKCLLAAIQANGEPGPANTTDPLSTFQVGQRNLQFSNCELPLTNATTSNGNVTLTLTAVGTKPTLTGTDDLTMTLDDPTQAFFTAWQPGAGTAYSLTSANGQTTVRLGRTSVVLASVPFAAGQTVTATATGSIAQGESGVELQIAATLTDSTGARLVANGLTCAIPAGIDIN
jgi:hypothetical protein